MHSGASIREELVSGDSSGTAGRTENWQIGVFLAYVTGRGRTLIDRRLCLPTSWTDDRERCRRAGIDDTVAFETKVAMAKAMVRRAIADKVPFRWVTADAAYGYSKGWRFEMTSDPPAFSPPKPGGAGRGSAVAQRSCVWGEVG